MLKLHIGAIALLFACTEMWAQNYEVTQKGDAYTQDQILNAMENADLCGLYYRADSRILNFDDGTEVLLKPEKELQEVNSDCVSERSPLHEEEIWEVKGHFLIRRHKESIKK
ncbi:MAG: hypothetical protein ACQERC_07370 [Bacteroidota bacterium]